MMREKIEILIKLIILGPIFLVVTTAWIPFMILKDLWLKSAKEVNNLFDNKQGDVVQFKK